MTIVDDYGEYVHKLVSINKDEYWMPLFVEMARDVLATGEVAHGDVPGIINDAIRRIVGKTEISIRGAAMFIAPRVRLLTHHAMTAVVQELEEEYDFEAVPHAKKLKAHQRVLLPLYEEHAVYLLRAIKTGMQYSGRGTLEFIEAIPDFIVMPKPTCHEVAINEYFNLDLEAHENPLGLEAVYTEHPAAEKVGRNLRVRIIWEIVLRELLRDPTLDDYEIYDLDDLDIDLEKYARYGDLSMAEFERFAGHDDDDVRYAIAGHDDLPEHLVEKLAGDDYEKVRLNIAGRDLPDHVVVKLAGDDYEKVREIIARREELPEHLVKKLAGDPCERVRGAIARRPDLLDHLVEKLAGDDSEYVRGSITGRKDLSDYVVEKLAGDDSEYVRRKIAKRDDLPEHVVEKLAGDDVIDVKMIIADRDHLPEHVMEKLAGDDSEYVRGTCPVSYTHLTLPTKRIV